jgi:hypothetical protein
VFQSPLSGFEDFQGYFVREIPKRLHEDRVVLRKNLFDALEDRRAEVRRDCGEHHRNSSNPFSSAEKLVALEERRCQCPVAVRFSRQSNTERTDEVLVRKLLFLLEAAQRGRDGITDFRDAVFDKGGTGHEVGHDVPTFFAEFLVADVREDEQNFQLLVWLTFGNCT